MKQRFFQRFATLFVSACSILCPSEVFSHEFELGHVERSLDVVVRDCNVQISYAIGLADITMLEWLVRDELLDRHQEQRFRTLIEEHESSRDAGTSPMPEEDTEEQQTDDSQQSTADDGGANEAAVEPAEFQKELADLFKEKLFEKICGNLQLTFGDQVVPFAEQTLVDTARHHVVLEARLVAEIRQRETGVLRLVDENFLEKIVFDGGAENGASAANTAGEGSTSPEVRQEVDSQEEAEQLPSLFRFQGNIRRACRVKAGAVLVNSNVAPVLARAKAVDVAQMDHKQRVLSGTIEAKLAFANQEAP